MNMAGNLGSFMTGLAFPYLMAAFGSATPFFALGAVLNLLAMLCWVALRIRRGVAFDRP
jgi:ACS family glucarate transporter-like MFS transporter